MADQQATVLIQYHFDAVSVWQHAFDFENAYNKHSRGLFGVRKGAPRILDLHDRLDLPATWFIPGHTIESFPDRCEEIAAAGYNVQHHGWTHTPPQNFESEAAERADFERGIETIEELTGERPTGYSSTSWGFSEHTLDILRDLGFEWDTSLMADDFSPYYVNSGWQTLPDGRYDAGTETDLLEFPVSWHRDDWPPFQHEKGINSYGAKPHEEQTFDMWKAQFDWMYENVDGGVFNMTFHPQIIGHAPRIAYLEELFRYMDDKDGVRFATFDAVADEYT